MCEPTSQEHVQAAEEKLRRAYLSVRLSQEPYSPNTITAKNQTDATLVEVTADTLCPRIFALNLIPV